MENTQESVADIVAEMRHGLDKSWHEIDREWAHGLPDRLEAARKREEQCYLDQVRDAMNMAGHEQYMRERAPIGNAAKMREVLEQLASIPMPPPIHLAQQCAIEIREKAIAALAEPPRNCDRFGGDIDRLREACLRERGLNPEEDFPDVFPDWLLAPSTEKEGGAKWEVK